MQHSSYRNAKNLTEVLVTSIRWLKVESLNAQSKVMKILAWPVSDPNLDGHLKSLRLAYS